jgi:hypothetical protein
MEEIMFNLNSFINDVIKPYVFGSAKLVQDLRIESPDIQIANNHGIPANAGVTTCNQDVQIRIFSSSLNSDLEFDFPSNEIEQAAIDTENMQCDSSHSVDAADASIIMHDDSVSSNYYPFGHIGLNFGLNLNFNEEDSGPSNIADNIGGHKTDLLAGFFGSFGFVVGDFDKGCGFDSGCGSSSGSGFGSGFGSDF